MRTLKFAAYDDQLGTCTTWDEPARRYSRYFRSGDQIYHGGLWFQVIADVVPDEDSRFVAVSLARIDPPASVHYLHPGDLRGSGGQLNIGSGPFVGTIIMEEP